MSKKETKKSEFNLSVKIDNNEKLTSKSIALIGMSGFFPESDSIQDFCEKLGNQQKLIKEIPDDHDPEESIKSKKGAFVKNLRGFDAKLFNINNTEAKYISPQQRLLLMAVWHLFEDACILPSSLNDKRVAVIIGKEINPYSEYLNKAPVTAYTNIGMFEAFLANRISNYFNFNGPSYCIDTSCSSGLTALHQAKKMLRNNEVDYAVVAGVNLIYGKEWTKSFYSGTESMGLMTTEKDNRPFQEKASGFTSAEGVVSLLLKRSDEAKIDKDNIHALILGSESNHVGGIGNITFPDANQQSKAIISAYNDAEVPIETITHIEAHASSSILADSQEVKAFKLSEKYFGIDLKNELIHPCKISTLKPNIGHMHSASGLASLVRLVYSFKEQKKLGINGFAGLSNEIKLDNTRYYITDKTEEWKRITNQNQLEIPRRGAINSYGGGGNNVHVILEEYVHNAKETVNDKRSEEVFFLALSCIEENQFLKYAKNIKNFLEKNSKSDEQQLEQIYINSRKGLNQRIVFRYKTIKNLIEKLNKYIDSEGQRGYYLKGNSKEETILNEMFLKNEKVVKFIQGLNSKEDKSFLFDLWVKGYDKPIKEYYKSSPITKSSFPGYPFKYDKYWLEIYNQNQKSDFNINYNTKLLANLPKHHYQKNTSEIRCTTFFSGEEPFIKDHVINGKKVLPGVAYLEIVILALSNTKVLNDNNQLIFENITWLNPFTIDNGSKQLETIITKQQQNNYHFEVLSTKRDDIPDLRHNQGLIKIVESNIIVPKHDLLALKNTIKEVNFTQNEIYDLLRSLGFYYGTSLQNLQYIKCNKNRVIGQVDVSKLNILNKPGLVLPPYILDAVLHALVVLDYVSGENRMMLPFSLDQMVLLKPLSENIQIVAGYEKNDSSSAKMTRLYCDLCSPDGEVLIQLKGFIRFPYEEKEIIKKSKESLNTIDEEKSVHSTNKSDLKNNKLIKQNLDVTSNPSITKRQTLSLFEIEETIKNELVKLLGTDQIEYQSKFTDLGIDSMAGVEMVRIINEHYGLSLSPIKTYDYPTINSFAKYVNEELQKSNSILNTASHSTKLDSNYKTESKEDHNQIHSSKNSIEEVVNQNTNIFEIEEVLKKELVQLVGTKGDTIELETKFTDMGLDSMGGVELVRLINQYYNLSISAIKTYDYPNSKLFAEYIHSELLKSNTIIGKKKKLTSPSSVSMNKMVKSSYDKDRENVMGNENQDLIIKKRPIDDILVSKKGFLLLRESDRNTIENCPVKPNDLGNKLFQKRYGCKWSYYVGGMYRGIASEELVVKCGNSDILGILGYMRLPFDEVDQILGTLRTKLANKTYGIGFSPSSFTGDSTAIDMKFIDLYIKHEVPVLELATHIDVSKEIVYARCKGLRKSGEKIIRPRLLLGKLSRLELAEKFMSPAPYDILVSLINEGLISEEEAEIAKKIPLCDDIVFEGSSAGYTDQQPVLISLPSFISLRNSMMIKYGYTDQILIGYGGGLGTPSAIAATFMMGADFVLTGSINQCTVESGMSSPAKKLLENANIYDFDLTPHGYALKYGFKIQALNKGTKFVSNSKYLGDIWNRYDSLESIPETIIKQIEKIFGRTLDEVWDLVIEHKKKTNPDQINEAHKDPKLKMTLVFIWYYAFTQKVTLTGDENYIDHYQIHSGPAMGAFNQFVKGTEYENWQNRHVNEIAELLMNYTCPIFYESRLDNSIYSNQEKEINTYQKKTFSKEKIANKRIVTNHEVAVIGVAGKFPKASNVLEFWENIKNSKDCVDKVPPSRWNQVDENKSESFSDTWLGVLDDIDKFDPLFFNISPRAAEWMDPQQRLFLETSWHCFEDAGYTPNKLVNNKCGVFVGSIQGGYGQKNMQQNPSSDSLQGGSQSILSARIAYFLNLVGPCMTIDTACSSSLVALSEACNSLILGQSDMALCGGVYIEDGAESYRMYSDSNMLSKEGRCFTFDQRANGFVAGEGVGCVLLKRLEDAEKDGDTILGIVKGWGVNQDGATNGITAPSMNSQKRLQTEVYNTYNINPENIQLVEAHGTGTALGDPIEVTALTESFRSFTRKENYCALGSVKSNIGHLAAAAGISGFIKLLMALKYAKLPPTNNFEKLNSNIKLENSPFYISRELRDWYVEKNQLRCAAINSFGFSGTNAHAVLEEYRNKKPVNNNNGIPKNLASTFVLSAKNKSRLKNYSKNIIKYLRQNETIDIASFCYTFQVGREAMNYRFGCVFKTKEELIKNLESFLLDKTDTNFYYNKLKNNGDISINDINKTENLTNSLIDEENWHKILELWVNGIEINWESLYKPNKIQILSGLPTYPFAKESYWISNPNNTGLTISKDKLHPLVHTNISNYKGQRFTSNFIGKESFLQDHKVRDEKILPGVAYLELAREAGAVYLENEITQIKNVTWLKPVRVNGKSEQVKIDLFDNNQTIEYEIYSSIENKKTVHSRGKLITLKHPTPASLDVSKIQNRLLNSKTKKECYEIFKNLGLDYGKTFQGIERLYYNEEESLSEIKLPENENYVLQPGILDSALQTCIGLSFSTSTGENLSLPFSVREVTIYGDVSKTRWAYVRKNGAHKAEKKISTYSVILLSDEGKCLLEFKDFMTLPLDGFQNQTNISLIENEASQENAKLHLFSSEWKEQKLINQLESKVVDQVVLLAGISPFTAEKLNDLLKGQKVIAINETNEIQYFNAVLEIIQSKLKGKNKVNILIVYNNDNLINYGFASGLLKTAHVENPKLTGKTLGVSNVLVQEPENLANIIEKEQFDIENEVSYVNEYRKVRRVSSLSVASQDAQSDLFIKDGGVYLITGGAGGLGKIFANYISKINNTRLILTGRSACNIDEVELESLNAVYYSCDVVNEESVENLIKRIITTYGKLDGIIHSAGVIRDSFLLKKSKEESRLVLSPKILGAKNLDRVTKDIELDFMIYFSSMSGVMGNIGQGDYASANAWLDNYAHYREKLRKKNKRSGHSLSINWPLWKDGGMQIDEESEKYMEQKWGIKALPSFMGTQALEVLLKQSILQGIVAYGNKKVLSNLFNTDFVDIEPNKKSTPEIIQSPTIILSQIEEQLISIVSDLLKLKKEHIELDVDFAEYGIDSIIMMKILNVIEESFDITAEPTAIVNYPTISELAGYLQSEIGDNHSWIENEDPINTRNQFPSPSSDQENKKDFNDLTRTRTSKIAIIGMSCHLPGSENLEQYWDNLKAGKDLISDIPLNRWNALDYYSAEGGLNKTYTTKGGFIKNAGIFDADYFNISDDDAISMDPQQRIVLDLSRSLLAHSGYTKEELSNTNTSVFIGAKDNTYIKNNYHLLPEGAYQHTIVNNISNMIAARISDFYNLKGTSQIIDTACSSSLVAIHQGCENILQGRTDMVIAGGISIMVDAFPHIGFSQAEVLSRDGKSYVFDERAQGFVMGEGGGLVLLKSYEQAKIDGDHIYGIIVGSSVNNDGKTMGLTVPNKEGQKNVIRQAFEKTSVLPKDITYYEAHGTGTLLGDPIEVKAATEVYQSLEKGTNKKQYCAIGSVKSNIGHTMTAAGISGLIKILLQLQHQTLVPTLHCERPHQRFKFEESPFYPNTELKQWAIDLSSKRNAAISSFGFGGTNCHMIIQEATNEQKVNRQPLPVEYISNNYYWLGEEIVKNYNQVGKEKRIDNQILTERLYKYDEPIMKDHLIFGNQVLMGVAHLALSINAVWNEFSNSDFKLEKVLFSNPLILNKGEEALQEYLFKPNEQKIEVHYRKEEIKTIAARSVISNHDFRHQKIDLKSIHQKVEKKIKGIEYYNFPNQDCYGITTQTVEDLWYLNDGTILSKLKLNSKYHNNQNDFLIHPAIFDGAHVSATLSLDRNIEKSVKNHRPPLMIKRVKVSEEIGTYSSPIYYTLVTPKQINDQIAEFDIELYTDQFKLILVLEGFTTKSIPSEESLFKAMNRKTEVVKN
ncbi:SDR family NAD(P)-dependent oxidoreductase [Aquimarina sp. RZ0]|uniref:SDR family NAD(P)-dependent oxidoreductase n=1 Tax=Aquimarina sp. RZ0 TaxID=2607730 RepID=UPI0011F1FC35|nr:SDR family NAD(P)-dependent oxidoreductase [Aquimarina sp. RZ0]KAA1246069.1 SDR family NAD(P)-dependent oxidoreductase [Aquimarina sp. RZ0]